jgi:hypothetical protein
LSRRDRDGGVLHGRDPLLCSADMEMADAMSLHSVMVVHETLLFDLPVGAAAAGCLAPGGGGAGGGRITQSWLGRRSGQRFHEHEGKSASPHFRNRRRDCETLLPCCIAWLPYSLLAKLTTRLTLAAPWIDPLTVGMNEEEDFPTCTAQQTG